MGRPMIGVIEFVCYVGGFVGLVLLITVGVLSGRPADHHGRGHAVRSSHRGRHTR